MAYDVAALETLQNIGSKRLSNAGNPQTIAIQGIFPSHCFHRQIGDAVKQCQLEIDERAPFKIPIAADVK